MSCISLVNPTKLNLHTLTINVACAKDNYVSTVYTFLGNHPTMWLLRRGGILNGGQYRCQSREQYGPEGGCLTHQLLGQLHQPVATQSEDLSLLLHKSISL